MWLLEKKFLHDESYNRLLKSLKNSKTEFCFIDIVPFSEDVDFSLLDKDRTTFSFGSYTLAKASKKYFKPGAFISDNFRFNVLLEKYGDMLLNNDLKVIKIKELEIEDRMFVRPDDDSKSFTGAIFDKDNFDNWKRKLARIKNNWFSTVKLDSEVVVSSIKNIDCEIRVFVVNKVPVAFSTYKTNYKSNFKKTKVDEDKVLNFCKNVIDTFNPEEMFVVDLAIVEEEIKIIEFNCFNSSGLYGCDTDKIVCSVNEYLKM
jgi:Holliday junction resolvase RusA-like endonuclease